MLVACGVPVVFFCVLTHGFFLQLIVLIEVWQLKTLALLFHVEWEIFVALTDLSDITHRFDCNSLFWNPNVLSSSLCLNKGDNSQLENDKHQLETSLIFRLKSKIPNNSILSFSLWLKLSCVLNFIIISDIQGVQASEEMASNQKKALFTCHIKFLHWINLSSELFYREW